MEYEEFIDFIVSVYMAKIVPEKLTFPLKKDIFIDEIKNSIYFVRAKPSIIAL